MLCKPKVEIINIAKTHCGAIYVALHESKVDKKLRIVRFFMLGYIFGIF